jgi:VWFA-related protein
VLTLHGPNRLAAIAAFIASGILILAASAGRAAAQIQVPAGQAQPSPPAAGAPAANDGRISIDVEVTDKLGHPIPGLDAADFTLLDNNQPAKLLDFSAVDAHGPTAGLVHVVIVVDAINTGITVVGREREQLGEFLKQDGGELSHPTSIGFLADSGLKMQQGFTQDGNVLFASLDKANSELRIIGNSAGFYGAAERLQKSLGQLSQLAAFEAAKPGRKLIFVISPGWPMLASAGVQEDMKQRTWVFNSIVELSTVLREAHVALYSLEPFELGRRNPFYYQSYLKPVSKVSQAEYPDLALQVLAEHSGGLALVSGNDIKAEINTAIQDANSYYALTFAAAPATERTEYHSLQVKVDKPGVTVRTTAGYYVKANP